MFFDLNRPKKLMVNNLNDFKMPHQHYGKTAKEFMVQRYNRLHNQSVGLKVRLFGTVYGQTKRN